jgi:hypothetical protein
MADLYALSYAHDGMKMVWHGHRHKRRPAALLFQAAYCFQHESPATSIIKMTRSAVLVAKSYEDWVCIAGPGWAMVGERLA